jgi:hypothetical protein
MEVFNSDHGSNILGCGNLCTAGSHIFENKGIYLVLGSKLFSVISIVLLQPYLVHLLAVILRFEA